MVDEVGQFIGKIRKWCWSCRLLPKTLGNLQWPRMGYRDFAGWYRRGNRWYEQSRRTGLLQDPGALSTRLQLSSSNTSEVIQKRLLAKLTKQKQRWQKCGKRKAISCVTSWLLTLQQLLHYVLFYQRRRSSVDNYPFVPWHYQILQSVWIYSDERCSG